MAAKFSLMKAKNGQFYFNLKVSNGETILTSEMYQSKSSTKNGIVSVKKNAIHNGRYCAKEDKRGWHFCVLRARNNQVIGRSESYSSVSVMENGIESVKRNAPRAQVENLTQ